MCGSMAFILNLFWAFRTPVAHCIKLRHTYQRKTPARIYTVPSIQLVGLKAEPLRNLNFVGVEPCCIKYFL